MPKKMLIDATHAEETRVVVVDGNKVEEFDFESVNKKQLAGNIHLARVTRVEPSLQAAFVDYGGGRHGFLAFSEIHPDYYHIPVSDRGAPVARERAEDGDGAPKKRPPRRHRPRAEKAADVDAVVTGEAPEAKPRRGAKRGAAKRGGSSTDDVVDAIPGDPDAGIPGMDVIDVDPAAEEFDGAHGPYGTEDGASREAADAGIDSDAGTDAAGDGDDRASGGGGEYADAAVPPEDDAGSPENADGHSDIESVTDAEIVDEIARVGKPDTRNYKIQEVIKVRQVLLVQVVKEERGNKGAALTTYLSLAGRYCVLMPNTARGGGISRKITDVADRKKLKEIADDIVVPEGAGLIIRTAGAKRTKAEIKRDYEYLQRLWEQVRDHTLKSTAPAPIYEEGSLIKRSIRDLYNREIDEVLVEGEQGHREAEDFMKMLMPSHSKNVKLYQEDKTLFARFQVDSYLAGMFNPRVDLKSGGYIVIGVTEALVAIDVNSGRATREASVEETALKTNLEAADEVARQLRLRDLAGLIVIDFIDMVERRNNTGVEKRLKDRLKSDRARIQMGRISGFGMLEMSRQRLRPGMLEASTQPCQACHGTGLLRSNNSLALQIIRQLEEEGVSGRSKEVLVKVPTGVANFMMNEKREHIALVEARYGLSIRVEGDPLLVSPDFSVEKFRTATRILPERTAPVISVDMDDLPGLEEMGEEDRPAAAEDGENQPKKKRRRRGGRGDSGENAPAASAAGDGPSGGEAGASAGGTPEGDKPAKRRGRGRGSAKSDRAAETGLEVVDGDWAASDESVPLYVDEPPKKKRRPRRRKAGKEDGAAAGFDGNPTAGPTESKAGPPGGGAAGYSEVAGGAPEPESTADFGASGFALPEPDPDPGRAGREFAAEPFDAPDPADGAPSIDGEGGYAGHGGVDGGSVGGPSSWDDWPEAPSEPEPEPESEPMPESEPEAAAKSKRRGWWVFDR